MRWMVDGEYEKIPNKEWQSTPVFLPGESHGQKSLAAFSPWDCNELDMTEWLTYITSLWISLGCKKGKLLYLKKKKEHTPICQSFSLMFNLSNAHGWSTRNKFSAAMQCGIQHYLLCIGSDQIRSVAQSCLTLCDPMNRSTPGLPVHQQLPEFTQSHVHRVSDAIQPSHPLSSPSPPVPNPSQHQSLFQWVNSLHEVAKVLAFQL